MKPILNSYKFTFRLTPRVEAVTIPNSYFMFGEFAIVLSVWIQYSLKLVEILKKNKLLSLRA